MPVNFNSVSGPTPNPGGAETQTGFIVFGPTSTSSTSAIHTVDNQPLYIQAYNLATGDAITVDMVNGNGTSIVTSPLSPVFGPVVLTPNRTKVKIDYPGRYRFVHTGPSPISSLLVTGFIQTMTQEPTMDLASALYEILSVGTAIVVGVAPILVTGTGRVGNPYVVSAINASDADMELGTSSAVVVEPSSLSHILRADSGAGQAKTWVGVGASAGTSIGTVAVGIASGPGVDAFNYDGGVFIGAGAFRHVSITSAPHVVAVGTSSLSGTSGATEGAIGIGYFAGANALNFDGIAIGPNAFHSNSTILGSIAIGRNAGLNANGSSIVAVGENAGQISGSGCIAVGPGAAQSSTNVSSMVAIGPAAASSSTYLRQAIAIGENAGAGVNYTAQWTNMPTPIPAPAIFIGNNAGNAETHFDVIIIGTNGDGTNLNATLNHQIILGTSTQTQLVTAGSLISGGVIGASDERLKKDIAYYDNGLDIIDQLSPVTFSWDESSLKANKIPHLKADMKEKQYGLIAQDVIDVLPEIVSHPYGDCDFMGIHYDRLIPVLISAVKTLSSEISELKKQKKRRWWNFT